MIIASYVTICDHKIMSLTVYIMAKRCKYHSR